MADRDRWRSSDLALGSETAGPTGTVTFTSIFPACYSGRWPRYVAVGNPHRVPDGDGIRHHYRVRHPVGVRYSLGILFGAPQEEEEEAPALVVALLGPTARPLAAPAGAVRPDQTSLAIS
ncbi:MAG TPA: hypothetical protein VGP57_16420 [Actinoplanes sp.]|nr:hypothetical protein [Actinoplanes sp.]